MTRKQMAELRLKAIADARKINDAALAEKREMTAEETKRFDDFMAEGDRLIGEMKKVGAAEERAARLAQADKDGESLLPRQTGNDPIGEQRGAGQRGNPGSDDLREIRWRRRNGHERSIRLEGPYASPEYRAAFDRFLRHGRTDELRTLQADSNPDGGFLLSPQQMVGGILKAIDDQVHIRGLATIYSVPTAASLGTPTIEANPSDADWTPEVPATTTPDTTLKFGKRELKPINLAKAVDISRDLIRMVPDSEEIVRERLAYKVGITMEKAYLTGTGAGAPLGVFTATAQGIPTGRDVSTGNTTTAITDAGLIAAKYSLKGGYRSDPSIRWLFHRDAISMIRKLKDSVGGYLWKPGRGLERDDGDRLLDIQVLESEYAPNTFTTGQYVGILGAWRYYWIADALQFEVQTLVELLARQNLIEYIGRAKSDGMPVLDEAFTRVTLA